MNFEVLKNGANINSKPIYPIPYFIKAEWTAYLIFSIIFVPVSLLWTFLFFKNPHSNDWIAVLISIVFLGVFMWWIGSFKITIDQHQITYKTLFSRLNIVNIADISKLEVSVGLVGSESSTNNAYYRLIIHTKNAEYPLIINLKPFSTKDIIILVNALSFINPSIELDELSQSLRDGDIMPMVNAGISKIWQICLWILFVFLLVDLSSMLFL